MDQKCNFKIKNASGLRTKSTGAEGGGWGRRRGGGWVQGANFEGF